MKTIKTALLGTGDWLVTNFLRWRRYIFLPFFIVLVLMEVAEMENGQPIHYVELVIYFLLIVAIALLIESLLRSMRLQSRALQILDYKHQINRELIAHDDWNGLTGRLIERLAKIAGVNSAQLFLWEPAAQEFSFLAQWSEIDGGSNTVYLPCEFCLHKLDGAEKVPVGLCHNITDGAIRSDAQIYCQPVYWRDDIFALVRFTPDRSKKINREQIELLGALGDEIAIALMTGQDRKSLVELQMSHVAQAERHRVSQYLHDSLGQNIGYLNMKLEQFSLKPELLQEVNIKEEIQRMSDTARESYTIVRSKLDDIHSAAIPTLSSYLHDHAQRISERAGFTYSFTIKGIQRSIGMDVQRAVFYVFQEALSNVEKHAKARKVDIVLSWGRDKLVLTVADDGVGFNPKFVDHAKHFGLGIVRERIANVNGKVEVISLERSGTTIRINVPLNSHRKMN
jgi:signal transduction histidine kinase